MSMVSVHGPNTMYTDAPGVIPSSPAGATSTQSPSNGLVFNMATTGPRGGASPADYAWTASASGVCNPTTGASTVVTFPGAAAGSNQTITLTVSGAGTPPLANGSYVTTVRPVTGQPKMVEAGQQQVQVEELPPEHQADVEVAYDPGAHTVPEVIEFAEQNPDQVQALLAAERAGKDRSTLLNHLETLQG